jgi:hypothetical protein
MIRVGYPFLPFGDSAICIRLPSENISIVVSLPISFPLIFSRYWLFTRLWTTSVCEPDSLLNCVGRFYPSGSKQTFSVSPLIS